jgi:hypothetical protein
MRQTGTATATTATTSVRTSGWRWLRCHPRRAIPSSLLRLRLAGALVVLALLAAPAGAQELPLERPGTTDQLDTGDTRPPSLEGNPAESVLVVPEPMQLPLGGPPADGATLDCLASTLNMLGPELGGVRLVCDVAGAAADEVNLGLRITLINSFGATTTHEVHCADTLAAGSGHCVAGVIDRAGIGLAEVNVDAVLLPSGRTLGLAPVPFAYDKQRVLP